MNKKIILLAAVGIILLSNLLFGNEIEVIEKAQAEQKKGFIVPKDPIIAGLLSIQYPGLGQVYCRRYLRGIAYFVGEAGCFILAATVAGVENRVYSYTVTDEEGKEHKFTQTETISKWDELSGLERAMVVGLPVAGVGIHIWGVIDAYRLAQKYNEERLGWIRDIDIQLGFKDNSPSLKLAVSKKF